MNIILYKANEQQESDSLWGVVCESVPTGMAEKYSSLEEFKNRLLLYKNNIEIVLLTARTKEELKQFIGLREFLADIRVILILPDRDHDTLSNAHALYPRFITYIDGDYSDLKAVLTKMQNNLNLQKTYYCEHHQN